MLSKKKHLFKKHLSKHLIETYRKLCREIDTSFKIVLTFKSSSAVESKVLEKRREIIINVLFIAQL